MSTDWLNAIPTDPAWVPTTQHATTGRADSPWVAETEHPDRFQLSDQEIDAPRTALGHDVREIWTHL